MACLRAFNIFFLTENRQRAHLRQSGWILLSMCKDEFKLRLKILRLLRLGISVQTPKSACAIIYNDILYPTLWNHQRTTDLTFQAFICLSLANKHQRPLFSVRCNASNDSHTFLCIIINVTGHRLFPERQEKQKCGSESKGGKVKPKENRKRVHKDIIEECKPLVTADLPSLTALSILTSDTP